MLCFANFACDGVYKVVEVTKEALRNYVCSVGSCALYRAIMVEETAVAAVFSAAEFSFIYLGG